PAAARQCGVKAVDAAAGDEVAEVGRHVRVLAGGDLEPGGRAVAQEPQALEIGRADRLLVPGDAPLAPEAHGPSQGLLALEPAVRVDVELRLVADRLPRRVEALRVARGLARDLDLHPRDPLSDPALELLTEPVERVRGEAAAAVDECLVAGPSDEIDERQLEEPRFQIPEREVDGRQRAEPDPRPARVPERDSHRLPGLGDREGVAALDDLGQLLLDELPGGGRRVAIAEARLAGGAQLDDVDRRRVP